MTELRDFNLRIFRSADQRWVANNSTNKAVQAYVFDKAILLVKCTNFDDDASCEATIKVLGQLDATGILAYMPLVLLNEKLTDEQKEFYQTHTS